MKIKWDVEVHLPPINLYNLPIKKRKQMDISQKILSDITVFNKYAKYIPEIERRETWEEIVERNLSMHLKKYPQLKDEIKDAYRFVYSRQVLPSMRSLQFGGAPIELANNRMFNCAFSAADHPAVFSETMFNLLGGSGVGFSVQSRHVSKLPTVVGTSSKTRRFLVGDSIEGWADAVKVLIKAYTLGKSDPQFDFRDIRPKGARLITSGGKAPGPDPLRICLDKLRSVLNGAIGRQLKPIEVHDMICHIADAVLSGGIRRAALISLFDKDDMDMLSSKSEAWWELNPQRGRANNSAVLKRGEVTKQQWDELWAKVQASGAGEPGIFWTDDYDIGTNPCAEISLNSNQYCNLVEVNVSDVDTQEELNARVKAATLLGTLQAGYTDFHYLRDIWKETTEREALLGVSMTGIGSGSVLKLDLVEAANITKEENDRVAKLIGINSSARITTVKPAGTTSLVVGSSSGVHAWHNDYYIRRMRVGKNEPLYKYMVDNVPELIEDCYFKPHLEAVMSFPQKAPEGSIYRTESFKDTLERVKRFNLEWVNNGHVYGNNKHNVSCTISLKDEEWQECGEWMWDNRDNYTGISVLPYNGGTYKQAPFEDCTKETYEEMFTHLKAIDLSKVIEHDDMTEAKDNLACSGGACEVT
jgi:ribonucleoside-diphosphate reductase alpha chain